MRTASRTRWKPPREAMRVTGISHGGNAMATLQLYAIWAVLFVGAAGAALAWWLT
jgi:hypothetical protein